MLQDRVYFPGLNGIRALAALSVVIAHTDQYKMLFQLDYPPRFPKLLWNGSDSVTLFFVLSGFLITYLLLVEHQHTGTISVRNFYARRILRIWPLYYLLVFIGIVVIPLLIQIVDYQGFNPSVKNLLTVIFLFLVFVPNAVGHFGSSPAYITHLWTIGIEEQFYLIWPFLMKKFIRSIGVLVLAIVLFKVFIINLDQRIVVDTSVPHWFRILVSLLTAFRIENMAVGAFGAFILFHNQRRILDFIFHPVVEKLLLVFMLCNILFFSGNDTPYVNMMLGFPYAMFILNVAANPRSTIKLENRLFDRLGRYSYGIYMVHVPVIYLVLMGMSYMNFAGVENGLLFNLILHTLVLGVTIGVAAASYRWFEQPFLRLKECFTIVQSAVR